MKRFCQLLLLAPLLLGSTRIINGEPVSSSDYGYWQTVRLMEYMVEKGDRWIPTCTATIIAPDLVLTAAHCVQGRPLTHLLVGYEAQPLSLKQQENFETAVDVRARFETGEVDGWFAHPLYGTTDYDHDLAVIKLKVNIPVRFSPAEILPQHLMSAVVPKKNYRVLLMGYGLRNDKPLEESEILRKTMAPAVFEGLHLIVDQSQGSGGCRGDSGGPAYLKMGDEFYLVGVTHGAAKDSKGCRKKGVWVNPALEREFLNNAAVSLESETRF